MDLLPVLFTADSKQNIVMTARSQRPIFKEHNDEHHYPRLDRRAKHLRE